MSRREAWSLLLLAGSLGAAAAVTGGYLVAYGWRAIGRSWQR